MLNPVSSVQESMFLFRVGGVEREITNFQYG